MIATTLKPGTIVHYSDMANPGTDFEILEVAEDPWSGGSAFRLRDIETGEIHYTDGRQNGWTATPYRAGCAYCAAEKAKGNRFFPSHDAMPTCRSGGRNHCTCDTCF
jgi:hypothetical protein